MFAWHYKTFPEITKELETEEDEMDHMFSNFFNKYPTSQPFAILNTTLNFYEK